MNTEKLLKFVSQVNSRAMLFYTDIDEIEFDVLISLDTLWFNYIVEISTMIIHSYTILRTVFKPLNKVANWNKIAYLITHGNAFKVWIFIFMQYFISMHLNHQLMDK